MGCRSLCPRPGSDLLALHRPIVPRHPRSTVFRSLPLDSDVAGWQGDPEWDWEARNQNAVQELDDLLEDEASYAKRGPGARSRFQDVAVLLLLGMLGLAVGNLAIKLLIVTWALAAAAFRYTILGVLLMVLLSVFT